MAASSAAAAPETAQPLKAVVKEYAWGIRGLDSRVARYALESGAISQIDPAGPYAELWIGTHPKGPATLPNDQSLEEAAGGQFPFMLKVLSAGKALSIQAHPDKSLAEKLNAANPQAYGDDNHKPEMAIALTPFEAMCGFRRLEEIEKLLTKHPEFAACVSNEAKLAVFVSSGEAEQRAALKALFASFMECPKERSSEQLKLLLLRLQAEQADPSRLPHDEPAWERKCARAIIRLAQQYPGDPGTMAPFFLNYLLIAPGESFFMGANEPHAYVAGEIIEVMACSDNVVRAGLTAKFKDVSNLVNMLTYTMGGPKIESGTPLYPGGDPRFVRYTPPVPEFEVICASCPPGEDITLPALEVPALLIVTEGTGSVINPEMSAVEKLKLVMRPGRPYFIPSGSKPLVIKVSAAQRGPLQIVITHENQHLSETMALGSYDEVKAFTGSKQLLPPPPLKLSLPPPPTPLPLPAFPLVTEGAARGLSIALCNEAALRERSGKPEMCQKGPYCMVKPGGLLFGGVGCSCCYEE